MSNLLDNKLIDIDHVYLRFIGFNDIKRSKNNKIISDKTLSTERLSDLDVSSIKNVLISDVKDKVRHRLNLVDDVVFRMLSGSDASNIPKKIDKKIEDHIKEISVYLGFLSEVELLNISYLKRELESLSSKITCDFVDGNSKEKEWKFILENLVSRIEGKYKLSFNEYDSNGSPFLRSDLSYTSNEDRPIVEEPHDWLDPIRNLLK